jgi:hypothetical protein
MAAAIAGANHEVRVTMLGASLPADQLRRRLLMGDVDVLALSCSIPANLTGAAHSVAAAHDVGVPVIAGGQAFGNSASRALAIGADAWAADAEVLLGPLPELAGRSSEIPAEVLMLDAVDNATIAHAYYQLVGAVPGFSTWTRHQEVFTREDIRWMARSTAGALLTDDESILDDLLVRLRNRLGGVAHASVVTTAAKLLADSLEPHAPGGAAFLRDVAANVEVALTAP